MDSYEADRQALLKKLLDSVKQCQSTFGGKTNLATDKDSSVSCLLSQFEHALQHGLKKNRILEKITSISEPFRQVTQKMLPEIEVTFWSAVKENLGPLDIQHYSSIEEITSDAGKARVWLRTALNEHSLERNLNALLASPNILRQFYEPWALILDEERASTIPIMAQGLGSILFAVSTRNSDLNQPFKDVSLHNTTARNFKTHRRVNSSPLPVMAGFDTEPSILKKINVKKKKKRKVATINDLEEVPGEIYSSSYGDIKNMLPDDVKQLSSSYGGYNNISDELSSNINPYTDKKEATIDIETRSAPVSPVLSNDFVDLKQTQDNSISNQLHTSTLSDTLQNMNTSNEHDNITISNSAPDEQTLILCGNKTLEINENLKGDERDIINTDVSVSTTSEELSTTSDTSITTAATTTDVVTQSNIATTRPSLSNLFSKVACENDVFLSENQNVSNSSPSDSCTEVESLGSENSKYVQLFMSYDQESSQAASDTLALLTASTENNVFDVETAEEPDGVSPDMEKYIPKVSPPPSTMAGAGNLSAGDLKQAVLATAKKKDEVEEQNRVLQAALDEQRELVRSTQSDYETLQVESHAKDESNKKKIVDLTREVDVLKNQLKKYVAAVQMLRKDKILSEEAKEAIVNLRVPAEDVPISPKPKDRTTSENDSIFEDKLAQMAEMHGELMEFQETLQRQLVARDNQISRMKQELVSLRGPLPQDLEGTETVQDSSQSLCARNRPLINIWIPSVFLKGKGTDAHHLYQIYIRIDDEEWNIYRRYSQFNKLNLLMCKSYPELENFDFPKKKMFGKKDIKFVEDRRHKLQEYLRTLINICISNHTELTSNSSKLQLVKVIPFFGEKFGGSDEKKNNKKENAPKSPHYTGLVSFPEI